MVDVVYAFQAVWITLLILSVLGAVATAWWPREFVFRSALVVALASAIVGFACLFFLLLTPQAPMYEQLFWIIVLVALNWLLVVGIRKSQLTKWPESFSS